MKRDEDRKLITAIKAEAQRKRLTVDDIVSGCEAIGEPVSTSTVRRIMQAGSEELQFRTTSLLPVAHFILNAEEDAILAALAPATTIQQDTASIDEIRDILKFREAQIAEMRVDYAERAKERSQEVEYLQAALERKNGELQELQKATKQRARIIMVLGLLLFLFWIVATAYLAWDLTHPTAGAFQWETSYYEEATTNDV